MFNAELPTVSPDATTLQAMRVIDAGAVGMALVIRPNGTLFGVLTDGDIRRSLVAGGHLDDAVKLIATRDPYCVRTGASRADVIDLMRARRISHAPVLDAEGRVVALHTLAGFLNPRPLPNHAVVMAGGRGTRLGSLTSSTPKPMIRVAGRPILEWIVLNLVGFGMSRISIAVNYLADVIVDHFGDGSTFGAQISYIREDPTRPLGTAGALTALRDIDDAVLVMNGDLMTRFDPGDLLGTHQRSDASATIALHPHNYEVPFGVVVTDDEGTVMKILEKPVESWDVAAGIYVLEPQLIKLIPVGEPIDIPGVMELATRQGLRVASWRLNGEWADIGRPADLSSARGEFLR